MSKKPINPECYTRQHENPLESRCTHTFMDNEGAKKAKMTHMSETTMVQILSLGAFTQSRWFL